MSTNIDLKEIQRKVYLSYHEDGLIDLMTGLAVLGFGADMATKGMLAVLSWIWILLYAPLKRFITVPRIGYASFPAKEKRWRISAMVGVFTFTAVLGLAVFLVMNQDAGSGLRAFLSNYVLLVFGGVVALVMAAAGIVAQANRMFVYAGATMAAFLLQRWLALPEATVMMALGAGIALSGLVILVRFLRKYPVQEQGDTYGEY